MAQFDGDPVVGRKLPKCIQNAFSFLRLDHLFFRRLKGPFLRLIVFIKERHAGWRGLVKVVVTQVGCQRAYPGAEGAIRVEAFQVMVTPEEGVLGEVFCVATVSQDAVANVEDRGLVGSHQRAVGFRITLQGLDDEIAIGRFSHVCIVLQGKG